MTDFTNEWIYDTRRAKATVDESSVPPLFTPGGQKPIAPRQITVHYAIPSTVERIHVEVLGRHTDRGTKRSYGVRSDRVTRRIDAEQVPYTDAWIQEYVDTRTPSDPIGELRRMIESLRSMHTPTSEGDNWNAALDAAVSVAQIRIKALGGEVE